MRTDKMIELNWEYIEEKVSNKDCTLMDIWVTFKIPTKYTTFKNRYNEYRRTGHEPRMHVTTKTDMEGNDVWIEYNKKNRKKLVGTFVAKMYMDGRGNITLKL